LRRTLQLLNLQYLLRFTFHLTQKVNKITAMKKFSKTFLKCINETQITSVRAGKDRTKFTGIWMVVVGDRIFGRSYYGSERSWYTTLLNGEDGDIKCGKEIIHVKGVKPADINAITDAINKAYGRKYLAKAHNKKWVDGLCEPERVARTMEFVLPE
jgi:hypothetical protein